MTLTTAEPITIMRPSCPPFPSENLLRLAATIARLPVADQGVVLSIFLEALADEGVAVQIIIPCVLDEIVAM